jgi:hypothetical protein
LVQCQSQNKQDLARLCQYVNYSSLCYFNDVGCIVVFTVIQKNEMGGHVTSMGDRRGADRVLVRRPEGKRQLERPRGI